MIRRLMKYLPKSSEVLQSALAGDERVFDRFESAFSGVVPESECVWGEVLEDGEVKNEKNET